MRHARTILTGLLGATALSAPAALAQEGGPQFTKPYWIDRPVLEALGRAELQVPPNEASFRVGFENRAESAGEATRAASDRAKAAYAEMKKAGGDAVSVTSTVSLNPVYEQYRDEDGYLQTNYSPDAITGYNATVQYSVTVSDMSKASRVRAAALALGPENSSYFSNSLNRTGEMLIDANKAAIEDAKRRAKASASAAGVSLGRLLVVQEGQGPCLGEWVGGAGNYDAPGRYRSMPPPPPPPSLPPAPPPPPPPPGVPSVSQDDIDALDLPNEPETVSVTAEVCLVYALNG